MDNNYYDTGYFSMLIHVQGIRYRGHETLESPISIENLQYFTKFSAGGVMRILVTIAAKLLIQYCTVCVVKYM